MDLRPVTRLLWVIAFCAVTLVIYLVAVPLIQGVIESSRGEADAEDAALEFCTEQMRAGGLGGQLVAECVEDFLVEAGY